MNEQRQIFLHGPLGRRQFREVLSTMLASLLINPDEIWLVSPWLSDFPLLDNRSGQWNSLEPKWGSRTVSFSELLARAVTGGCALRIATRDVDSSRYFVRGLENRLGDNQDFHYLISDTLHSKGFLTRSGFLKGSLNYTFSGTQRNDEHVTLTQDAQVISDAFLEFKKHYCFEADT
ncbi:hypothetical protein C4C32_03885 [Pseudomonas corrugata]|uniref:Phospholipase D-like domain-containing protein n=1 Tax=Pseudomonas corrugata TaxID=47879 RepID=A0A8B6UT31_9PSED|nr:phospholipase D-like domain-containing protein DpdK [Pseudomonas corrugata]QTH15058.1 hypothetical protein C4C32_03885 [Pseudomonas corrugata]